MTKVHAQRDEIQYVLFGPHERQTRPGHRAWPTKRSIAWGIAQALHEAGAELAFSYQGDLFRKRVVPLVEPLKPAILVLIATQSTTSGSSTPPSAEIAKVWDSLDFVVHAIAFSNKGPTQGPLCRHRAGKLPHDHGHQLLFPGHRGSAALPKKMMPNGGAMVTLTYAGAERVMPHYNVMGVAKAALEASVRYMAEDLGKKKIRVNSISAGPIKTLAFQPASPTAAISSNGTGINSPLRRTVTQAEVGNSALFLLSDLGSAVTGENLHVDAGYHVVGMKAEDAPDIAVVQKSDARS